MVSERLEISSKRKPLAKAHALFYEDLKEVGGKKSKTNVVYGKNYDQFLCGKCNSCKAGEGWHVKTGVIAAIFGQMSAKS